MNQKKTVRTVLSAAAALLALSACSSGGSDQDSAAPHNKADVAFAQQMIPHHRQALDMVAMVRSHSHNAKLTELANRIGAEQQPEIQKMSGWLKTWGAKVPQGSTMDNDQMTGMQDMPGMVHGPNEPAGMMSEKDMAALQSAKGAAFDRMWLQMMVKHHEGAIDMARTEQRAGQDKASLALASSIMRTQNTEIKTMQTQLKG